jgi:hypothetical protein
MAWEIVYDLDGTDFDIANTPLGAGDMVIPLQPDYAADDTIGPGTITLMIADNGGSAGDGPAQLVDMNIEMNFATSSFGTTVTQTLVSSAGDTCGAAVGSLSGTDLSWSPNQLDNYNSSGNVNCQGGFCGTAGFNEGDNPIDETSDINPFSTFSFSGDLSSFTAPGFVTSDTDQATTSLILEGTETGRTLVSAPACICG